MERSTGIRDEQLNLGALPEGFEYLGLLYMEIQTGEGLTYQDVDAFERVRRHKLSAIEVTALFAMDRGAQSAIADIRKESQNGR